MSGYDQIGQGYTTTRRPDLRIAAALHAALAGMESVINVGAGTGSYEPAQTTAAVEPSAVMIASGHQGPLQRFRPVPRRSPWSTMPQTPPWPS